MAVSITNRDGHQTALRVVRAAMSSLCPLCLTLTLTLTVVWCPCYSGRSRAAFGVASEPVKCQRRRWLWLSAAHAEANRSPLRQCRGPTLFDGRWPRRRIQRGGRDRHQSESGTLPAAPRTCATNELR
jgi:hypothetical protein